jgi:hypothetical protein
LKSDIVFPSARARLAESKGIGRRLEELGMAENKQRPDIVPVDVPIS